MHDTYLCYRCTAPDGNVDPLFEVESTDVCGYISESLIRYCPFCGRRLRDEKGRKVKISE